MSPCRQHWTGLRVAFVHTFVPESISILITGKIEACLPSDGQSFLYAFREELPTIRPEMVDADGVVAKAPARSLYGTYTAVWL
jgi:hypothetical protein